MQPSEDQIERFWRWFTAHAGAIALFASANDTAAVVGLLDPRVRELHAGLAWELGPGPGNDWAFVLSPNGASERLATTRAIMRNAPLLNGWEFHAAKPPKRWEWRFDIREGNGRLLTIDASRWNYSLIAYDTRRFFDVMLVAPNLEAMQSQIEQQVGYLVVEGAIGEELALEKIGAIEVIREPIVDPRKRKSLTRIQHLSDHLRSLIGAHSKDHNFGG